MRSVPISVTDAARNFADCINRVRYQGTSFILQKNGVAVARIVPADEGKARAVRGLELENPSKAVAAAEGEAASLHIAKDIW